MHTAACNAPFPSIIPLVPSCFPLGLKLVFCAHAHSPEGLRSRRLKGTIMGVKHKFSFY